MPRKTIDLTGMRFGRLVVQHQIPNQRRAHWSCLCDCGNTKIVEAYNLKSGHIRSCKCLSIEMATERNRIRQRTHGQSDTDVYAIWANMKDRCKRHPRYAGRGITYHPAWEKFESFAADMGPRPPGTSIERVDNDGNYEPGNCRWATDAEQNNNRSDNRIIEYDGKRMTASQWARHLNIKVATILSRLNAKWPDHLVVSKPVQFKRKP